MPVTRLGLDGYGVHRAGSFAGKTPSGGGGAHPVKRITRLGPDGYGVRREGSFAGKASGGGGGSHPVVVLTRLSLDGYGARRAGNFGAKTHAVSRKKLRGYEPQYDKRIMRDDEELMNLAMLFITEMH